MAPKRATRSTRATTTPAPTATTTTNVTNAQLQAMINEGVSAALAARDATRNGTDSHSSGTGTEGVVELTQWFERMETVFRISNCSVESQIKFATCTLLAGALTWWNSHKTNEEARGWVVELKVGTDVVKYITMFQELALLCVRLFPEEAVKIERFWGRVGGIARHDPWKHCGFKTKDHAGAIEMATELMDKRVSTIAERQAENKEELDTLP
ncbi:hypothetical protein Tco_0760816 [Tanacetum coccineum]